MCARIQMLLKTGAQGNPEPAERWFNPADTTCTIYTFHLFDITDCAYCRAIGVTDKSTVIMNNFRWNSAGR